MIPLPDDGIVVLLGAAERGGREGEMWEIERALTESLHFTQTSKGRWNAEYEGFVTMAAEGDTPTEAERQLSRAMDVLLASLIRGPKDRETTDSLFALNSLSRRQILRCLQRSSEQFLRPPAAAADTEPLEA